MLNVGGNAFKSIWSTGPFRHYKCQMYLIFFNHDSSNTFFLDIVRLKLEDSAHRATMIVPSLTAVMVGE